MQNRLLSIFLTLLLISILLLPNTFAKTIRNGNYLKVPSLDLVKEESIRFSILLTTVFGSSKYYRHLDLRCSYASRGTPLCRKYEWDFLCVAES